jgi:hypothetical protein
VERIRLECMLFKAPAVGIAECYRRLPEQLSAVAKRRTLGIMLQWSRDNGTQH